MWIWSSFPSILFCSKYLQSNFEVPGLLRSLSLGLIPTVLRMYSGTKTNLTHGDQYATTNSTPIDVLTTGIIVQYISTIQVI